MDCIFQRTPSCGPEMASPHPSNRSQRPAQPQVPRSHALSAHDHASQAGFRPVIYLASPLGFSATARDHLIPLFTDALTALGAEVYEPFSTNAQNGLGPESGSTDWALDIAAADSNAVRSCDAIFAVINGLPPDEGVCVELGIAAALGKPTFLFRDDFRKAADSELLTVNLMIYAGLPRPGWEEHIYTSLSEINDPDKALVKYIASCNTPEPAFRRNPRANRPADDGSSGITKAAVRRSSRSQCSRRPHELRACPQTARSASCELSTAEIHAEIAAGAEDGQSTEKCRLTEELEWKWCNRVTSRYKQSRGKSVEKRGGRDSASLPERLASAELYQAEVRER